MLVFGTAYWQKFLRTACIVVSVLWVSPVQADIIPDSTLPTNSNVKLTGNTTLIEAGTKRGSNLFHSFKEFSVPTGNEAYFNNSVDINNIITRVTGGSISNIDGLIKANGTANLFLINPNGIVFGKNAQLDIGGSFVGSTADAIGFDENNFFSASNPQKDSSLLQINPNALFFNQIKPASIENESVAKLKLNQSKDYPGKGLQVPDGKSLMLVGGDVNINGGGLVASGGRVELGGLATTGTVGLNVDGNNSSLNFPSGVERSDVTLSNDAGVRVAADDGGSIAVNARNLEMTGDSFLFAGINERGGSEGSKAGNIDINATGAINLDESEIANQVQESARGEGGDININTNKLQIENGSQVFAATSSTGNGGNLNVDAQDIQVIAGSNDDTGFLTEATRESTGGNAGNLTIKTNTLLVQDGAEVSAGTSAVGNGGNLNIEAQDIEVIGVSISKDEDKNDEASRLTARGNKDSTGNAGNLNIKTNTLLIKDGAEVSAGTNGEGNGGNITIEAQDVQVIGASPSGDEGSTSRLEITADEDASGTGDLTINTNTLLVQDGGLVDSSTDGKSDGGDLTINAQVITIIGQFNEQADDPEKRRASTLSSSAKPESTGDAGNLNINSSELYILDGGKINAEGGLGEGGDLNINTGILQLEDEAAISVTNKSGGSAGNLTIIADSILNNKGKISAETTVEEKIKAEGDFSQGGNITINTSILQLEDEASISVTNKNDDKGSAGNIKIIADSIHLNNESEISADTETEEVDPSILEQASIYIRSKDLIMRFGSKIKTNATSNAEDASIEGGNINIVTDILAAFENSDITANSNSDRGGNVLIETQGIFGIQFRLEGTGESDITATGASEDLSGDVEIINPDIDLNSGLVNLPSIPVETEVAEACTAGGSIAQSKFEIIGRGGLPHLPTDALSADALQVDLVSIKPEINKPLDTNVSKKPLTSTPKKIVEATGWVRNKKGEIFFVTDASNAGKVDDWYKKNHCRG